MSDTTDLALALGKVDKMIADLKIIRHAAERGDAPASKLKALADSIGDVEARWKECEE